MIGHVEANMGEIDDRLDPDAAHPVRGADTGAPQQQRVLHDAGAQHHIARAELLTVDEFDADRALVLDQDPPNVRVAPHDQVGVGARRFEIEQQVGLA